MPLQFKKIWEIKFFVVLNLLIFTSGLHGQVKLIDLPDDVQLKGQIYHPLFAPAKPYLVAYERQAGDKQKLFIYNILSGKVHSVSAVTNKVKESKDAFSLLMSPQSTRQLSIYEGQLDWRPILDAKGRQWFIFVSSGEHKSYDLYLSYVDQNGQVAKEQPIRLERVGTDHFPRWSPDGNKLIFVGQGKKGMDLYLCDHMNKVLKTGKGTSFHLERITANSGDDSYPVWSPGGRYIAYQAEIQEKGILNVCISLIDVNNIKRQPIRLSAELNMYNEYKPSWSADCRFIAFYMDHMPVTGMAGNQMQDICVLQIIRNVQTGNISGGKVISGFSKRLAENVLPNLHAGPLWYGGTDAQSKKYIIFAEKNENSFNPLIIKDFSTWREGKQYQTGKFSEQLGTKLNRELTLTRWPGRTVFAFVAQEGDINQLKLASLKNTKGKYKKYIPRELDRSKAVAKSIIPGLGQFYKGQKLKGSMFILSEVAAVAGVVLFQSQLAAHYDDVEKYKQQYAEAVLPEVADERYRQWKNSYEDWESAQKMRNIFAISAIGIWGLNLLDSALGFPRMLNEPIMFNEDIQLRLAPMVSGNLLRSGTTLSMGLQLTF
ncbi:PD40 domain-containing protein [bacterium]|nr:PD40 domain-containing protein [bacterium]